MKIMMKRIISATVMNQTGVLNRITGVLSRRRFNIENISVGHTDNDKISRMTFVVYVDSLEQIEQLTKQLNKQIDVLKVMDITDEAVITRELALIRITANNQNRNEIYTLIAPFRANVVDVAKNSICIQVVGTSDKIDALIDLLRQFGIKEVARTGVTAIRRGNYKPEKVEKFIMK